MIILNFSHPLTPDNLRQIEELSHSQVEQVLQIPVQFDPSHGFAPLVRELLHSSELDGVQWQTFPILVNLPALNVIAAVLLSELHGRVGYFPTIIRLRQIEGMVPLAFEVAELINLQAVRDTARCMRQEK